MRFKSTITLVTAVAAGSTLAVNGGAFAAKPEADSATGGGQFLFENQSAGSTIAFTAQGVGEDVKGQVQFVDRSGGTGQAQEVLHGTVSCITVEDDVATIAGEWREPSDDQSPYFDLYVVDNDEGAASESDLIYIERDKDEDDCNYAPTPSDNDPSNDPVPLARGNAQVNDGDTPPASE